MTSPIILQIAIPAPLRRLFDYLPPKNFDFTKVRPGVRVRVPFGARKMIGIFVGTTNTTSIKNGRLKHIIEFLDEAPIFNASLFHLCQFASDYYHAPLGEVFDCAMPLLLCQGKLAELQQQRFWRCTQAMIDPSSLNRSAKQKELLHFLQAKSAGVPDLDLLRAGFQRTIIQALEKKGLIESFKKQTAIDPHHVLADTAHALNAEQKNAVDAIHQANNTFKVFLLEGVTGSGKTEVYLQVIAAVLAEQKQALVLVPEIGLTPQTIQRFQARFTVPVVALHSGLNESERLQAWMMAKEGIAKIIIGTRSAVFVPLLNPGIIIIDEEHDLSFKQQDGVRYHARDLAIVRAQFEKISIVLGSATPSLESYYKAKSGRFQSLILSQRAGTAQKPTWTLFDLRQKKLIDGFSPALTQKIKDHLTKDPESQVLIFLNRRGYAPTLMCHHCAWTADCHHCHARMTLHQLPAKLHCHHCDRSMAIPKICPKCQQRDALMSLGVGTERLEAAMQAEFGKFGIVRVDRDSTTRKGSLEKMFQSIHSHKNRILVGTQMIAKGHHFPRVTLVAVIDIDSGFFSTDFRAIERTAQLLLQVAGRAGRAEKLGEVAIQTLQPEHPVLAQLVAQSYRDVLNSLLQEREQWDLPPFTHAVLLRAEAMVQEYPIEFLQAVRQAAVNLDIKNVRIMTPIFAPMPKRAGRFRAQLLLLSKDRKALHQLLKPLCEFMEGLPTARRVRWSVDVDPQEMM